MALRIKEKLVLASQSPSRRRLLEQAGVDIEVIVSGADETVPEEYTPSETVECLAQRKAMAVERLCPGRDIIAAVYGGLPKREGKAPGIPSGYGRDLL